jgi:hypothetical protein
MAVCGVGARRFARSEPVVELPPVIGTGIGRIDVEPSTASIAWSTRSTLGQPDRRRRISPPAAHTARSRRLRRA